MSLDLLPSLIERSN